MATYYPSSNSQRDATPMLYTRESFPATYSDAQVLPGNMMIYSNYPSSSGSYSDALAVNSQQQNSCVQIPSIGTSNPQHQDILANFSGSRIGEHGVNAWRDGRNDLLMMHPMGGPTSILHGGQNLQGQALSLSLGTQIPSGIQIPSVHFRDSNSGLSAFLSPNSSISGEGSGRNGDFREDDDISMSKQSNAGGYLPPSLADSIKMDSSPYEMSSIGRTVSNSKYLKAALELLDEVVNVRKALKQPNTVKNRSINELQINASKDADRGLKNDSSTGAPSNPKESTGNSSSQLSPSERQELQNKMTKLLSMLDEVDRRYKQYYHQMQIVVSSFDVIAGSGAARPYTSLALQTISRHFRCLRDAISGQIRAIRKSLGELDASSNNKGVGIARLRFVDQQLRQQRAIQQLGMMQHHTWRPQRGLPESSVSVLRAWLFEHFLHPYPKDSDKTILARQTGLTRSQVSNWFINARVRLWKPMVEEMYKEEFGDNGEMDSNSSTDNAPKPTKSDTMASEDRTGNLQQGATSSFAVSSGLRKGSNGETETDYGFVKLSGDQRANAGDCNLFPDTFVQSNENADRFMAAYEMSELGRFGSGGNGVSLTLGLQHRDGNGFPISDETHHNYIAMRENGAYNEAAGTTELDCMETGSRQHRFSSSHLMHDFVA